MATIEKRIGLNGDITYRVKIRVKGYPPQTNTFTKKTKAQDWASKTETMIKDGQNMAVIESKKHTLGELIDRYINKVLPTKEKQNPDVEQHLGVWKSLLGHYSLIALKPDVILKARDEIQKIKTPKGGEKTKATMNRYHASLSVVLNYAVRVLEWLEVNPMNKIPKLPEPRGRVRYLDPDELKRLENACKESTNNLLYPIVMLAITSGARKNEILNLTWDDVDLNAKRAILHDTKNGERRTLPIVEPALSLLQGLEKNRKTSKYVFPSREFNGAHPANIHASWYAALEKAEITNFRFHDLRHTAASYFAMGGATMGEIADILGHKTLQMTKRYSHLSDHHKQSVVERVMSKGIFGGTDD